MSDPFIDAMVALTGATIQAINTLSVPPEERLIIIAEGKQFRSGDRSCPWKVPEWYRMPGSERAKIVMGYDKDGTAYTVGDFHPTIKKLPAIPLVARPDGSYEYLNLAQGVRFIIKVIQDKLAFRDALVTPGAHVVYAGHARYGRGPCFGPGGLSLGEMWEEGVGNGRDQKKKPTLSGSAGTDDGAELPKPKHPNNDGIFRLGAKYIGVEAEEIIEHGYTANLLEAVNRPKAADCDKDLQKHVGALTGRTIQQIDPALAQFMRNPDPAKKWWSYWGYLNGKRMLFVVHVAGWQNTLSEPDDIGSLTPTCRVFSHMGCSTLKHNHDVVRYEKQWKHEGNERYAYFTTDLADFAAAHYWVQHLLDFGEFNAFQPLEKSLQNAVKVTNKNLSADHDKCRVK